MLHDPNFEPSDPVLSNLLNLRNLLSQHWGSGAWISKGNYCILGGIQKVVGVSTRRIQSSSVLKDFMRGITTKNVEDYAELVRAIQLAFPSYAKKSLRDVCEKLIAFNDHCGQKAVLRRIDVAIEKRLEAKVMEKANAASII